MKLKNIAAMLLVLMIPFSSCSSKSVNDTAAATSEAFYDEEFEVEYVMDGASSIASDYENGSADNDLSERKIIKTADLSYQTQTYDEFINALEKCIDSHGGYIESSELSGNSMYSSRKNRNAYIIARVPADKYDSFLGEACELGTLTRKSERKDDVTMSYVDVESHIKALNAEYDSLIALMEKAESLTDVIELQTRLTEVNYQLDSYKSQLRKYDDLISYCTVNIDVNEVIRETIPEREMSFGDRVVTGLEDTFSTIGESAVDFAVWFIVALPYIAIWAAVIALVMVIIKLLINRKHKGKRISEKKINEIMSKINEENDKTDN